MVLLLLVCIGCGSRNTAPSTQTSDNVDSKDESWFCQVGATDDDWDCVQSEALAASHTPDRLPAPRAQNPAVIDVPDPLSRGLNRSSDLSRQPSLAPVANSNTASPPPPVKPTSQPKPAASAATSSSSSSSKKEPKHVALSYRPDKPTALLDLPSDFWAVQLVAVSSKEALEKWARDNKVIGMSAARIWNGQQMFYILLLGIYETRENAEEAIESLQTPFGDQKPWVRSLGSLQAAMIEADRESGTSKI